MIYDRILIRYGEISTKGKNRNKFIDRLRKNIQKSLADFPKASVKADRDRMFVLLNGEDGIRVADCLKKIFGIQSFSLAVKTEQDKEKMKDAALVLFQQVYKEGNTFKISARRADKTFELDTNGINHELGGHLLRNIPGLVVDVRNPDINLQAEVRKEGIYLSAENIVGAGGMPAGSGGKAMLMLSGGIDSPVAGHLSMKRGLEVEGVHFFSPPFTSERARQKVIDLSEKLAEVSGQFVLHIVPFTEVQQMIHKQVPENYTMTSTRRIMLQITDELRKKNGGLAIITGESVGQVASQTLESMYAINEVTSTPVLRPLVMMDKSEIMEIAQQIETHDISIRPYEDCCTVFVPASPKTKPKLEKVQRFESFFDFEPLIQKAVEETETILIKPGRNTLDVIDEDLF
ncbi:tRNA uracil 4-sulfurtransferase ThiI [Mesobacillus zeae]|uniref:Probable tRNA sulfurtransferase n=1 Tax=Mesobacillus zeae TaxID=1917180 RepID=A0A398B2P7_9BACI|nr:tRNA uracil 4-sulfurtransferase ThiI [Mesobacillus zeae]RID83128.1 tRNA 4-thiouridine(8) synthase ThiI [Mesobacillus zeae]